MDPTAGPNLGQILARYYPILVARAYADAEADLGRAIPFDAAGADAITADIASRAAGIASTLRDRIASLVQQYADDPAALRSALEAAGVDPSKADEISKTEAAQTYNRGIVLASRSAGLSHVAVSDGDGDQECEALNGTTQTVAWTEAHPLGHPRCRRRFDVLPDGPPEQEG